MGLATGRAAATPPNQLGTGRQLRRPPLPNATSGEEMHVGSTRKTAHHRSGDHLKNERVPLASIGVQNENYLKINGYKRIQLLFSNVRCTVRGQNHSGLFSASGHLPKPPVAG